MVALSVAGIIVGLILLDIAATRISSGYNISRITKISRAGTGTAERPVVSGHAGALVARGMFHNRGHMWAHWRRGGSVTAGANDLLHRIVGRIDEVRPPGLGDSVAQGEKAVLIRQGERVLYLTSPVTGRVTAVNDKLAAAPGLVKDSPYEDGWIFEVTPTNADEDIHHLEISSAAEHWMRREEDRIRYFLNNRLQEAERETLDGGRVEIVGLLERLGDDTWILFKDQFIYQHEWRT